MQGKQILLVDDEHNLLATLKVLLHRSGHLVHTRENAFSAFEALRSSRFDLVILDLKLPDVNGMCLLAMCRRLYPSLPVLILTANDSVEATVQALRLGARGYLTKPLDPQQILYCVEEIFTERKPPAYGKAKVKPARFQRDLLDELDF